MSAFRIVDGDRTYEPEEIERLVGETAERLRAAGVQRREPVAVAGPHGAEVALAILGVRRAGATPVPLHPRLAPPERERQLRHCGARLLVGPPGSNAPGLRTASLGERIDGLEGEPIQAEGDVILYTSGTSAGPKGVLLDEAALEQHARACHNRILSGLEDVWIAPLTFAHAGGYTLLDRCARWGHSLVFGAAETLEATIRSHGATHVSLVPTQFRRWITARGKYRTPPTLRCVLVGGGATDPVLLHKAHKWGVPARATYGATETCGQVATALEDSPLGSVGPTLRGVDVGLEDEVVYVRGPTLFKGYHRDSDATRLVVSDGWWRSGDLGRYDEHGNLWILGREDDRITTGGEKVDPIEVEQHLRTHPSVEDAAVVGLPDPEWGEAVTAFVVLRPHASLDLAGLRAHCAGTLAAHKVPRRLQTVTQLPRSANGKLLRRALRS